MATEKFFVFNEDGALKRLKGRIVRFLDNEDPTGSDKSAIRTSLEVSPDAAGLVQADVGTAPNEIPVNGMLGDMAYQSSDGVSVGTVSADEIGVGTSDPNYEIEVKASNARIAATSDGGVVNHLQSNSTTGFVGTHTNHPLALKTNGTERVRIDSTGRVGVNQTSPGSYNGSADDLVVGNAVGHRGITISSGSGNNGNIYFADGTTGTEQYRGYIGYSQSSDTMSFGTGATTQWQINSSGDLVAYSAGNGIDFGSTTTGSGNTVQSGLLDDFEEGSFDVSMIADSGTITLNPSWATLFYVKIGRLVYISGELVVSSVSSPSGNVGITGLPFLINASITRSAISCYTRGLASDIGGTVAFANPNSTNVYIRESGTTGIGHLIANNWQAGTEMIIGGCYHTS